MKRAIFCAALVCAAGACHAQGFETAGVVSQTATECNETSNTKSERNGELVLVSQGEVDYRAVLEVRNTGKGACEIRTTTSRECTRSVQATVLEGRSLVFGDAFSGSRLIWLRSGAEAVCAYRISLRERESH